MGNRSSLSESSASDPDETYFFAQEVELKSRQMDPFASVWREKKVAPSPHSFWGFCPKFCSSRESLDEMPALERKQRWDILRSLRKPGNKWVSCAETAAKWEEASRGLKRRRREVRKQEEQPQPTRAVTPENYWNPGWVSPEKAKTNFNKSN